MNTDVLDGIAHLEHFFFYLFHLWVLLLVDDRFEEGYFGMQMAVRDGVDVRKGNERLDVRIH